MNLYEYEGKQLFRNESILVPAGKVITSEAETGDFDFPVVAKAQTLSGKRGKTGLIIPCKNSEELKTAIKDLFSKKVNEANIEKILVEQYLVDKNGEYYFSITYDTSTRSPILIISKKGGVAVEEISKNGQTISKLTIDPRTGLQSWMARQILAKAGFKGIHFISLTKILMGLWKVFEKYDARLVEINPLIETEDEEFFAADAKIILDDDAQFRQTQLDLPPRSVLGKKPTKNELAAQSIDKNDHRGSAGSTYMELDGDIAVIAAGGGAV